MSSFLNPLKDRHWSRRQVLKWGLAGAGVTGGAIALSHLARSSSGSVRIPPIATDVAIATPNGFSPMTLLRAFDYGSSKREQGKTIREFRLTAQNTPLQLNSAVTFVTWNVNGRVPGPTLRATAGDRGPWGSATSRSNL
jgi:FtsP/CotA-like multicopper oxidase with cupredoxin domain